MLYSSGEWPGSAVSQELKWEELQDVLSVKKTTWVTFHKDPIGLFLMLSLYAHVCVIHSHAQRTRKIHQLLTAVTLERWQKAHFTPWTPNPHERLGTFTGTETPYMRKGKTASTCWKHWFLLTTRSGPASSPPLFYSHLITFTLDLFRSAAEREVNKYLHINL